MIILIDAYNLLKQILHTQFVHETQRVKFIKELQDYALKRSNDVVLIFDGGYDLYEYEDHARHIEIIYSGQAQTADDVIKKYLKERQGQNILLVSSDRELRDCAKKCSIESIQSLEFYEIMQEVMQYQKKCEEKIEKTLYKTTKNENLELDLLMEEGSRKLVNKNVEHDYVPTRIRNSSKSSKKDKKLLRKILKI